MTLREKLIVLRDKAGISQMSLAHQLGVSRQAVSRWESGDTMPSMDKLKAMAKIYDVSLDWLCSDADEMEGRDKQPTKKQEATEINEDEQQSAVQNMQHQQMCLLQMGIFHTFPLERTMKTELQMWLKCMKYRLES